MEKLTSFADWLAHRTGWDPGIEWSEDWLYGQQLAIGLQILLLVVAEVRTK